MPEDALAGGGEVIGIDESAEFGVIIAGLQVIETGLGIEALAGAVFGYKEELSSFSFIIRHIPPHRKREKALESVDFWALLYKENHSLYEWFNEAYGDE